MTEEELLQLIEKAAAEEWEELDLSGNELTVLPFEIFQLTKLQSLDLGGNRLNSLPEEFGQLINLKSLYFWNNKLNSLPAEFGQLVNLQSLDLDGNQLSSLPAEFGRLTNLQSLDLGGNQLSSLPKEFGQLTNLQSLYLWNNNLNSLPAEFGQLTKLQSLYLSGNQLSSLPVEFEQLINLQSLNLGNNQLSSLPAGFEQLSKLQSLNLGGNQLSSLPVEFGQLINLQSLDLWKNKLCRLPEEFVQLINLQSLDLRYNQLSSLPEEFVQLTNLQFLNLENNHLESLPSEIGRLHSHLAQLELDGNPFESLPPEIRGKSSQAIFNFYKQQLEQTIERLYEAKLLIVGEGEAGKTSLAKKIENESYQLQSNEQSTEGIDVIQWKFTFDNDKEFRVNIWDFGGQEIYHQTHQFFLTKRSLYALVADNRRENTDFYWWLKEAELLSDNSPILIIKNEKQDLQCQVNERQLRQEFLNLKEVLPTNLATNRGLEEIKKNIQIYISNLSHVGTELPKTWVKIRSVIEKDSRNYIIREEYYKLCKNNNLTDPKDMLYLSSFLHDLGVCLHFQDDSTLKHYVILKPEWATTAVYKVLRNNAVINNLGRFTQEELTDIWNDSKYSGMQDELLQLMMRFKLCYQIPNHPGNYIAPQLLDIEQPEYDWDNSNNLILRYKYGFMPKGILTRFIVETHPFIEEQTLVWKSGVVLNKDETRAEVIENYNQKEIKIRVFGSRKKELLEVVTYELDKIHRSFERLEYQTWVPCNCSECIRDENPYSYPLEDLRKRLTKNRFQVECGKSYEMVDVLKLIDDVNFSPYQGYREFQVDAPPLQLELENERDSNLNISHQNQNAMNYNYQDFQILVDKNNNIRASSEQGDESGKLNLNINEINLTLELIKLKQTNSELLKALGQKLYQALFPNDINARFQATFAAAQENNHKVRLRLIFESPELAFLPWEFLHYERTNTFLGNNTETVLSRYIDVPLKKREIKAATLPLKVLVVISSPTNLATLDATGEENLIREALKKHTDAGQIELDVITEATTGNIRQKLREKAYNVFHFIGHGDFQNEKGYICLVDENNKSKLLDDETFANFFLGDRNLGLIILNCCRSATVSSNQAFAGTVSNLVRRGIPAAIAMQYTISDSTAKLFADEFYKTLALGFPVDTAIQETRNAISMDVGLDKSDFGTPVLYMRAKDGMILDFRF